MKPPVVPDLTESSGGDVAKTKPNFFVYHLRGMQKWKAGSENLTLHCAGTGRSTQAHQRFPRKPILTRNNLTYPSLHIHAHVTRCSGVTKVENVNINIMPLLIATDTFLSNLILTRPFTNKQKTHFWRLPYTGQSKYFPQKGPERRLEPSVFWGQLCRCELWFKPRQSHIHCKNT